MSSDLISSVKQLIQIGKSDPGRLEYILDMLTNGRALPLSDQKYLENIIPLYLGGIDPESIQKETEHTVDHLQKEVQNITQRLVKLEELWNNIPDFHPEENGAKEDRFQMLQGENQIHGKMKEMISNTKKEFVVLGSEKDFLKFYHSDFFAPLDNSKIDLKLLTSSSDRTMYIFDDIDRTKVKRLGSDIKENLCFIIQDTDELLFFTKNASQALQHVTAIWTDSSAMIHSMKLLFNQIWSKSKSIYL